MKVEEQLNDEVQQALSKGVLKRLPLTFLPFVNQQLKQWNYLFPRERQSVESLLLYVAGLTPQQSTDLFRNIVQLEEKMGVHQWQFSTAEQTIQNSSQLARSPYFQEWRRAVQAVFDAADQHGKNASGVGAKARHRLVLMEIPQPLTLDATKAWRRWQGIGRPIQLDLSLAAKSNSALELLLNGLPNLTGVQSGGLLDACCRNPQNSPGDTWVVDAGRHLVDSVLRSESSARTSTPILLSYQRLDLYRQNFSHEMNTMHKDLGDADAVFDRLRQVEVAQWCPAEVNADSCGEGVSALSLSHWQWSRNFWKLLCRVGCIRSVSSRAPLIPVSAIRNAEQNKTLYRRSGVRQPRPGQSTACGR